MKEKPDRVKVIAAMAKERVSCGELAEKTGLSRATISNVRNGKRCNSLTLGTIAAALGVPVENILEG